MYTLASKYEATWTLPRHINEYEYEDLPSSDRRKYVSDEGYISDEDDEPSVFDVLAVGVGVVDILSSLSSSPDDFDRNDEDSFDGFGDGSAGGAGATGEW